MVNKELKRLSRRELVDIIYLLKNDEQEARAEIERLKNELDDRRIRLSVAGSIAEAAMSVTNVFAAAQMTADLYLKEISYMKEEAEQQAADMVADAEQKCAALQTEYEATLAKWQQLKREIEAMEAKKHEEREGVDNGG